MRILLATVGTTGDVQPFAVLGRALLAAGHQVSACSWELHRPTFEDAGLRFHAAGPETSWDDIRRTAAEATAAASPARQIAVLRDFHLRDGEAHYLALRDALTGHDLVLLHGIHSLAEAAARDVGANWVTAVLDPVLLPTRERPPAGMPPLGPLNGVAWWLLDRILSGAGRPLQALLRRAGSASARTVQLFRGRSPRLHMVACSPVLGAAPGDLHASVTFTGAWISDIQADPLPAEVEAFLASGPAPAVVSFGSMAVSDSIALGAAVADGLRAAGLRAIVQGGAVGLAPSGGPDLLVAGRLDHRALFPRAAVVVHHGGAGTAHATAAAGVPSVVVPHIGDQAFWAERLHRLGAAPAPLAVRSLDGRALASRLREATTSPAITSGARALAALVNAEAGLTRAVDLLEALHAPPGSGAG